MVSRNGKGVTQIWKSGMWDEKNWRIQ